ncbi:MAG: FG-GAP repeat protein, partial [Candidatus Eiseniibacteriota bacterium]
MKFRYRAALGLAVLLLSAPAAHAGLVFDLRTSSGLVVWGADLFDNSGRAVAMGDVDGDGFRDIIIGSIGTDGAGEVVPNSGAVDIIWGDTRTNLGLTKDLLTQSNVHIDGADTGDQVGIFVVSADFNGDGLADLAVGASLADGPANARTDAGEVYVFYGRARALWAGINSVSQADATLLGEEEGDQAGVSLATGDVDGDGIHDLLVGASSADGDANLKPASGSSYVWFGGPAGAGDIELSAQLTINGADSGDLSGRSLATGDLDGDGRADIVIGVPNGAGPGNARAQGGEVAIVWGRDQASFLSPIELVSQTDVVIYGPENGDNAGTFVDAADFDGDSFFDVFVGVPLADALANAKINAGEAFLYYGRARAGFPAAIDLQPGLGVDGKRFIGQDAGDLLGSALASGDLDGDGKQEINLGAPLADGVAPVRLSSGEVFMYFGVLRGSLANELQVEATADLRVLGADAGDRVGTILDMGDLNNDGGLDLAMGAPGGDSNGNARADGGEVHILYGFGQVVPAILADFDANESASGGVELAWSTGEQSGILGFNL